MKNCILFFLIMSLSTLASAQSHPKQKTMYIQPESQLLISGDTNISGFSCNFDGKMLPTNCAVTYVEKKDGISFKNAVLVLNNKGFDCGNRQINKDFHALLQTEEYPSIELELKKVFPRSGNTAVAQVLIRMAGEEKLYEFPVKVLSNPATCFTGTLELDINDFGLEPPRKAFGLIKVKDNIEISFNLTVAE